MDGIDCSRFVRWHSLELQYSWNIHIFPTSSGSRQLLRSPHIRFGGVRLCNIKLLHWTFQPNEDIINLRIGLINARSVMNKTFLLHTV